MWTDLAPVLLIAAAAAFGLAVVSAVAGFGGGVLLLPVFAALFGLRAAVPMLTLTQLSSNASRVWLNRRELNWRLIGWFALGAVPLAAAGGLLLAHAPLEPLRRLLGVFLIGMVAWRRFGKPPGKPRDTAFTTIGAVSGLGSALVGSTGPLTAPFFLAYGLTRAAYIGTEAASALAMHLTKLAAYGAGDLITGAVLTFGLALTPATIAGAWVGKHIVDRISDRLFVLLVEAGLVIAGLLFLIGV
ncbi:MAG TPA: sulfite exporter TauE/SafE family protein [Stackebrandtia sp.]|uniref:sulfite exporter TauE/SafE family protein n=1 Tax=Stackebrandtia sp. TaxID=2023065 RepID=UPI002D5D6579|nr:sulfite exporter TauE/SafE family protein [Stackebrandtia sp.]HZE37207.1 sulfite exporter TauE/SafE family protein [Stackebrandtia sp.]